MTKTITNYIVITITNNYFHNKNITNYNVKTKTITNYIVITITNN